MENEAHRDKGDAVTLHPNTWRLLQAMRRIRFGRITEITVADGVPLKFRVEQLVDLSKGEEPSLDP
ncbi:MAG: hypothetical protein HRF45_06260 [Fimbriimonadia bacterium]|jgi:hypothetical protein